MPENADASKFGHKPEGYSDPFAWHGNNYDGIGGGAEFGFGLGTTGDMGSKTGWNGRSDLFTGGGFFGLGSDGQIGGGIGGRAAHIQAGYGSPGTGAYGSVDADAFGADAHAWVNPDTGASAGLRHTSSRVALHWAILVQVTMT